MTGFPGGLWPDLSRPYGYEGDGMFHAWMAQRVTEGWLFDNVRSGYPFGSNFLDFPGSDSADHFLIKILALVGGGWPAGVKLFFLLSFVICFATTYITARAFSLNRSFAFAVGILYTFIPFHFYRLNHLFYTWYFVAPLFFYLALDIYLIEAPAKIDKSRKYLKSLAKILGMLVVASFGIYYALFGVIVLACAAIMSFAKSRNLYGVKKATLLAGIIFIGTILNLAPNLAGIYKNGPNLEVAQRSYGQSEVLGLKMMQLLLPRADHRLGALGQIGLHYNQGTPLVNENSFSPLGVIGATGFILALLYLIFVPYRTDSDLKLRLLSAITLVLFLFATIGGLGTLFAMVVSPSIRGWNRLSIFIGCGALLFAFTLLQACLKKNWPHTLNYSMAIAATSVLIGLYDQTTPSCTHCNLSVKTSFDSDRNFVHAIETALPPGASIYQLPYIGFPEEPILHRLSNYQLLAGVLQSDKLHWSFGGMKGRPGDLFYRALAQEPLSRQIEVIRKLGFDGIYVDRRGYEDKGQNIVQELSRLLNQPMTLESSDNELVFFKLSDSEHPQLAGLTPKEIQKKAGYFVDGLGPRYRSNLDEGIDFTRKGLPDFISEAQGLYDVEPWGRWSAQQATFEFRDPLPDKFTLILTALPYGPNADKPTRVIIGNREYSMPMALGINEMRLDVNLDGIASDSITFIPPNPISPQQLLGGTDGRLLGIGFVKMKIAR